MQVKEGRKISVFLEILSKRSMVKRFIEGTEDIFPVLTFVNDVASTGNFILSNLLVSASR